MTVAEIRTAIRARGYETDTASAQLEAIKTIDRRIQGARRWPWNETSTAGALAVGDSTEPYPAAATKIDAVKIEVGTEYPELEFVSYDAIRQMLHIDRTNGTPTHWSTRGRVIYVFPRADRAYTMAIEHNVALTALTADGDTPVTPPEFHDLYVAGACEILAQRERDWNFAQLARNEYNELYAQMVKAAGTRQRQNATHVPRSSFWNSVRSYG